MNQKLISILFILLGVGIGYGIGKFLSIKDMEKYKVELKERVNEVGNFIPQNTEIKNLSGVIKEVNEKVIKVTVQFPRDPFGDSSLDERIVSIDENTKITMMVEKDLKVYQKEEEEFQKKINALSGNITGGNIIPPQKFEIKVVDSSVLKSGQNVLIVSASNIRLEKRFVASEINILPNLSIGSPTGTPSNEVLNRTVPIKTN